MIIDEPLASVDRPPEIKIPDSFDESPLIITMSPDFSEELVPVLKEIAPESYEEAPDIMLTSPELSDSPEPIETTPECSDASPEKKEMSPALNFKDPPIESTLELPAATLIEPEVKEEDKAVSEISLESFKVADEDEKTTSESPRTEVEAPDKDSEPPSTAEEPAEIETEPPDASTAIEPPTPVSDTLLRRDSDEPSTDTPVLSNSILESALFWSNTRPASVLESPERITTSLDKISTLPLELSDADVVTLALDAPWTSISPLLAVIDTEPPDFPTPVDTSIEPATPAEPDETTMSPD